MPDGDPNKNTVYPNMIEFKKEKEEERLESLVKKLKGIFWRRMKKEESNKIDLLSRIPQLKDFNRYFENDNYKWYETMVSIRGAESHKPVCIVKDKLGALNLEEIQKIAIDATFYAACVFRFVKTIWSPCNI